MRWDAWCRQMHVHCNKPATMCGRPILSVTSMHLNQFDDGPEKKEIWTDELNKSQFHNQRFGNAFGAACSMHAQVICSKVQCVCVCVTYSPWCNAINAHTHRVINNLVTIFTEGIGVYWWLMHALCHRTHGMIFYSLARISIAFVNITELNRIESGRKWATT